LKDYFPLLFCAKTSSDCREKIFSLLRKDTFTHQKYTAYVQRNK